MTNECYVCTQCGTQFAASDAPPPGCAICEHERQFVNPSAQQWTNSARLQATHRNVVAAEGAGAIGIGMTPDFAIGQRALLVRGKEGNVLWDCIPLLDDGMVELIRAMGGLRAIALSHPHFHTAMVDWAHAFNCPVYVHADHQQWVMRPDASIDFWRGERHSLAIASRSCVAADTSRVPAVMHYDGNNGALFTGDTFYVNSDRRSVGWMYSFPNHIPLSAKAIKRAATAIEPLVFETAYSAWWNAVIRIDAKQAIQRSAARYVSAIEGFYDD